MADTIKSFIDKLQADGVQAGKQAAEDIRTEADQKAKSIIAEANSKAESIIAEAKSEADSVKSRTATELNLAARDTVIKLQETLNGAIQAVLTVAVREQLADPELLGKILHDIVLQYVRADADGRTTVTINVSPEMRDKLVGWALKMLHEGPEELRGSVDLHGSLAGAGFEYGVSGGTVEVTVASVVETLSEMVSPAVRELLSKSNV